MSEQELDQLLANFLEDRYTDADAEKLSAWIAEHPDHANYLARLAFVDWGIKRHTAMASATDFFQILSDLDAGSEQISPVEISDASVLRPAQQPDSRRSMQRVRADKPSESGQRSVIVIPKVAVYGPLAALIVLALTLLIGSLGNDTDGAGEEASVADVPPPPGNPIVCRIESSIAAVWGETPPRAQPQGAPGLKAGEYNLEAGVVRLAFPNDVTVVVQSPATFSVVDDRTVRLADGRLSARVDSSRGHGFAVETDSLRIIDLGTEFGVHADRLGSAGLHVYDGEVKLKQRGDQSDSGHLVTHGQSVATLPDQEGMQWGDSDDAAVTRMDEYDALLRLSEGKATPHDRWLAYSRDMRRDKHLLAYYSFEQETLRNGRVNNLSHANRGRFDARMGRGDVASIPTVTGSRFGSDGALQFDRTLDQALVVDDWHDQAGGVEHLTVSAWVRLDSQEGWHLIASQWHDTAIPKDQRYAFHLGVRCPDYPLLAEGVHAGSGTIVDNAVQVPAPTPQAHVSGNGLEYHYGVVNSWRSDRALWETGRWHLVVLTIDAEAGLVTLYVDGEQADRVGIEFAGRALPDIAQPLIIGGKVVMDHEDVGMTGALDDVAIFDRLLSADEIRAMNRVGTPQPDLSTGAQPR